MSDERSGGSQPPADGGAAPASNGPNGSDTGADLRSMIAGAVADEKKAAEAPPKPEPKPEPAEPGGEPAPEPVGEPAPGPGGEPSAPEEGDDDGAPPPLAAKPEPAEAPVHWSAADKVQLAALPKEARGPFLNLYKRMEAGFTPKLQRLSQFESDYGEIDRSFFTPVIRRQLTQMNTSVPQLVAGWANAERTFGGQDPNAKALLAARIISGYGVDFNSVGQHLSQLQGFAAQPQPGASDRQMPAPTAQAVDPVLERRMAALEAETQRQQQMRTAAAYRDAGDQITAFANARDGDGNLKHPFYAQLEAEMTSRAEFEINHGRAPVLERLYEDALWTTPELRAKELTLQREAEAKKAAEERKAKSEQARRAAASVTGAPGPGQTRAGQGDMSLRDQIKLNMVGNSTSGGPGRI